MWQEKEKLQREVASLELQLKMKTKIAELDKQIQLQVSFFNVCCQRRVAPRRLTDRTSYLIQPVYL